MKSLKVFLCASTLFIFMSKPSNAAPIIGIGSMYDVLISDKQSMTKRIYNTGDSTAFVRVELHDVHSDSSENETQSSINNVLTDAMDKNRLVVTPQRLIIPPGSFQSVRILWPGSREKERYYRIRFIPVMPEDRDSFGLDKNTLDEYRKTALNAGLNVLTGYGTVVIIQPEHAIFKTVVDESMTDRMIIRNAGNATVSMENLRYCSSINGKCEVATREFILPDHTLTVKKKPGCGINFTLIEGRSKRVMNF
ncbi:hypothetical protein [Citrobacter portucalensis]|uniref:Molecular chaperone n=1 Tax=Citrobacter portucalensis TaxID=1639133 RepID=A0A9X4GRY4_9ENTR|nr:hypothetical protein [Citrobacter portucalensis]MDE9620908.1 hypothetical protein [Citrobacter portucalensis]